MYFLSRKWSMSSSKRSRPVRFYFQNTSLMNITHYLLEVPLANLAWFPIRFLNETGPLQGLANSFNFFRANLVPFSFPSSLPCWAHVCVDSWNKLFRNVSCIFLFIFDMCDASRVLTPSDNLIRKCDQRMYWISFCDTSRILAPPVHLVTKCNQHLPGTRFSDTQLQKRFGVHNSDAKFLQNLWWPNSLWGFGVFF